MIWTASRICVSAAEYFRPCHCSTMIRLDSPMPSATRPGARWPSVAALMPSSVGVRVCTGTTAEPTFSRVLRARIVAMTAMAS